MNNILVRTFLAGTILMGILACNPSVDDSGNPINPDLPTRDKLNKLVNGVFRLTSITYEDGRQKFVPADDEEYVFTVPSLDNLRAQLLCNDYVAQSNWQLNGRLLLSSMSRTQPCNGKTPKFIFNPSLNFILIGETPHTVHFQDIARSWTATFERDTQFE